MRAPSEALRWEEKPDNIRTTVISPGAVATERLDHITDRHLPAQTQDFGNRIAIPADSVARTVAIAVNEPADVDVNEILFRPTAEAI